MQSRSVRSGARLVWGLCLNAPKSHKLTAGDAFVLSFPYGGIRKPERTAMGAPRGVKT